MDTEQISKPTQHRRVAWTMKELRAAMNAVKTGRMSVHKAAGTYNIPRKTLEERYKYNNYNMVHKKRTVVFGEAIEKIIVSHIKSVQEQGFFVTLSDVSILAYELAERLHIKHRFNKENKRAGIAWLRNFLMRHSDLKLQKDKNV